MSTTQNYDFGQPNDDPNRQQSLDSAEASEATAGQPPREGILGAASGAVENISQVASNAVIMPFTRSYCSLSIDPSDW